MRAIGYGLAGLALGCMIGFWLGLMLGLVYAELAHVSCFDGLCSSVAARIGFAGAAAGGFLGASYALRRALRREPRETSVWAA